jgi:hypothetical protein
VKAIALPEAQPCSGAREVVPVPPDAFDHGFTEAFADTFTCPIASPAPSSRNTLLPSTHSGE